MANSVISSRTLAYLIIFAALCLSGLTYVLLKTDHLIKHDHRQKLLPQLEIDRVSKLMLRSHDTRLTIYKDQDGWKISEKYGYPVSTERVMEVLSYLAELRIVEPKTTNPEYYKMLGVNPVTEADCCGIELTLWDDKQQEQAQIIVGKHDGDKIFVRRPSEAQTWLAQGFIEIGSELHDWTVQPLLGLTEEDNIKQVAILQPSGTQVNISKASVNSEDYGLGVMQADKNINLDSDAINSLPYALSEIEYFDVIPAANLVLDWEKAIKVTVATFAGKTTQLEVLRHDGQIIARVDSMPGWYYKISDHTYALLAVANEDFIISTPHVTN